MRSVTTELHRWIAHELVVQRNPLSAGDPLVLKWCEAPFSAGAPLRMRLRLRYALERTAGTLVLSLGQK